MNAVKFENAAIPVYVKRESIADRNIHSEISHWHDHLEIIVVNNGNILCQTGGEEFCLHKGDICFINRKQLHQVKTDDGKECCHKVLIVGTSLLMQNALVYDKYIRPMLEDPGFSHIRFEGSDSPAALLSEIIENITEILEKKESGYEMELIAEIHLLGRQLYLAYKAEPKKPPADNNYIIQQKMTEYIYAYFDRNVTLDDIASAGAVSRSQCAKLFKKYTKLSPISFLNRHRLEVSLELLRTTGDSIADIAARCGFTDQSYYNRIFLREYGVTPLGYRKDLIKKM